MFSLFLSTALAAAPLVLTGPSTVVSGELETWTVTSPDLPPNVRVAVGWGLQNAPGPCPYPQANGGTVCLDINNPVRRLQEVYTVADPANPGLGIATFTFNVPPAPADVQVYLQAVSVRGPIDGATSNVLPTMVNITTSGPVAPTRRVGVGCGHTCWIDTAGDVNCVDDWASSSLPAAFIPGPWVDITADCYDTCMRNPAGETTCYDFNGATVTDIVMADAGYATRLELETDGSITEVGNGPDPVPGGNDWVMVDAGYVHACAIDGNADLTCWTNNGNPGITPPSQGAWAKVSTGSFSVCAIDTSDQLSCFGHDPDIVNNAPSGSFSEVAVGYDAACALTTAGLPLCWGPDANIQTNIPTTGGLTELTLTWSHACAMNAAGSPVCWGLQNSGGTPPSVP